MAGTVRRARLDTPTARRGLKRGRQAHWQALEDGRTHLGWQCKEGQPAGRWLLRRYVGARRYHVEFLGYADDAAGAAGMTHKQAIAKANATVAKPAGLRDRLTVRQAWDDYVKAKAAGGQSVGDIEGRGRAHILPELGDLFVDDLTPERLRDWLATMARTPAQKRPKGDRPQYRPAPVTDEEIRARRATANRVLTTLKAMLNFAFDEGHVKNRDAWGRKLKPFENVGMARVRYLTIDEARRLINASDPEFRPLVQAALETGCRYSELTCLTVQDFNPDAGTVGIGKSKSGKPRHVILTPEGSKFFRRHTAGKAGGDLMFSRDGGPWQRSTQAPPMREACARARIKPHVSFHILRHTWASHSVMNGVPLMIVARNLGHVDTKMVEKHYGHMAPGYIVDAIRKGAPRFGVKAKGTVVPLERAG